MKKSLLISAAILMSVFAYSQSAKAVKNYEKGTKAIESGNYQEGIKFLTLTIMEFPTGNAYFNRSAAYFYLGDTCSYCADLKKASEYKDFEAQKLYFETCTYCTTITNLPDSIKSNNLKIKSIQIFHSKCTSDSTVSYIYEKTTEELNSPEIPEIPLTDNSPVFTIVEEMPTFPGGEKERSRFLAMNIVYPEKATRSGIQGTVYVQYIVDKNGLVKDVKVLRGIGGGCDEESVRVVKLMPKWNPGKQGGKTVNVLFNMPIYFKLSGKK